MRDEVGLYWLASNELHSLRNQSDDLTRHLVKGDYFAYRQDVGIDNGPHIDLVF